MVKLTIDQALQQGIEAHKAGQVQEADRLYTAILKAQPKHPDANHNMGVLALGVGKVQEALPFFKAALEANLAKAHFWLSYIDTLIKLDKLAEAKAVLDQAKSKGAKGDEFDQLEQRLNLAGRKSKETIQISEEAPLPQPNILNSLKLDQAINLANRKLKEGSPEEAKRIYQDILAKFPKNKRARDGLKGLSKEATDQSSKVQDPPQDQLRSLMNFYNQGQLEQALEQANILLRQFPNSSVLYNICGAVLRGLGQLDASVEAYSKALVIKPDYAAAYSNMGNVLKDQGMLEEAIEAYNKAVAIKPDYAETYYNTGITLNKQGKLEEAIKAYIKVIAIKPDYADAYNNLGDAFQELGLLEEAIEAYIKALAIKPDYAEVCYNLGSALQEQGKLEEAIEAYNKAVAIKPDYDKAYNNMGDTLNEQGKLDEAIEAYNKALTINPDCAQARHMRSALIGETTNRSPIEYVKNLFDRYAVRFENSLVGELKYCVPTTLIDIVLKNNYNSSLGSVLDLGCGTGLVGQEVKNFCANLEGVDLSNPMLAQAELKNVYHKLYHCDIIEYLLNRELNFDYFISADVFIYVGDLSDVFQLIKSKNKKSGKVVFSTEHTELEGFQLEKTGRYSHSKSYIEDLCKEFGYTISHFSTTKLRKEKGKFLIGGLYIIDF